MIKEMTAATLAMLAIVGSDVTSAATPNAIDEVTVTAQRPSAVGAEARAVGICGDQVVSKLLPNLATKVRVVVPYSGVREFMDAAAATKLDVDLTATHTRTGDLLATASCTVSRSGEIEAMSIKLKDGTIIAELKPRDVRIEGGLRK